MKRIISCMVLFFMLLPMANFVFLLNYENTNSGISCLSKDDIISVQYELCKQTKDIVLNFSDIIVNDLKILSDSNHRNKLFFNIEFFSITNSVISINVNIEQYKINILKFYKNIVYKTELIILFISFVFMFLIRYLGLLRLFNSPLNMNLNFNKA